MIGDSEIAKRSSWYPEFVFLSYYGYQGVRFEVVMAQLSLLSGSEVQQALATHLRGCRKAAKLSREALAARSTVPAPTIKKFELTGQISMRQFLLLWQCLDDLERLQALTKPQRTSRPTTIDEVIAE